MTTSRHDPLDDIPPMPPKPSDPTRSFLPLTESQQQQAWWDSMTPAQQQAHRASIGEQRCLGLYDCTVPDCADCAEQARLECEAETYAENAWLRAAEYDPRLAEETERELAMEAALYGNLYNRCTGDDDA